jgi:hypothetical protein
MSQVALKPAIPLLYAVQDRAMRFGARPLRPSFKQERAVVTSSCGRMPQQELGCVHTSGSIIKAR